MGILVVKLVVSRMDFFEEWLKHSKPSKTEELFSFLLSKHDLSGATKDSLKTLRANITRFSAKFDERWKLAGKKREDFCKKYSEWLKGAEFTFEASIEPSVPSSCAESLQDPGPGRPQKEFLEASLKTKRRRVDDLIKCRSIQELMYAAEVSAHSSGSRNIAQLYPWYYMPATVHKLLIHGPEIVKSALLPIGQLSEEAQEARNKDCRRFRLNNTRKQSRNATNRDLLNMLLITSDPVINSLKQVPQKKTGSLRVEVLDLLISPSNIVNNVITNSTVVTANHDYSTDDSPDEMDE